MPYKTMILLAIVLSYFMYWSLSSVCSYNLVIDKKTRIFPVLMEMFGDYAIEKISAMPGNIGRSVVKRKRTHSKDSNLGMSNSQGGPQQLCAQENSLENHKRNTSPVPGLHFDYYHGSFITEQMFYDFFDGKSDCGDI